MADRRPASGVARRTAIKAMASSLGAAASGLWVDDLLVFARGRATNMAVATSAQIADFAPAALSPSQFETVGALVELIIPTTDTPGARTALVDRFVDATLADADQETRERFLDGLSWLDDRSRDLYGEPFTGAGDADRTDLLTRLSAESAEEDDVGVQFFTAIKAMTVTGYYSTEIGLRQELGDDGRLRLETFEGCTHPEHQ